MSGAVNPLNETNSDLCFRCNGEGWTTLLFSETHYDVAGGSITVDKYETCTCPTCEGNGRIWRGPSLKF